MGSPHAMASSGRESITASPPWDTSPLSSPPPPPPAQKSLRSEYAARAPSVAWAPRSVSWMALTLAAFSPSVLATLAHAIRSSDSGVPYVLSRLPSAAPTAAAHSERAPSTTLRLTSWAPSKLAPMKRAHNLSAPGPPPASLSSGEGGGRAPVGIATAASSANDGVSAVADGVSTWTRLRENWEAALSLSLTSTLSVSSGGADVARRPSSPAASRDVAITPHKVSATRSHEPKLKGV